MINQIPFTEIDIKVIHRSVHATWPADGFKTHESFDEWLRKTHINQALQPYLWGSLPRAVRIATCATGMWETFGIFCSANADN